MREVSGFGRSIAAGALVATLVTGCATSTADVKKQEELAGMERAGQRTDNSPIPPPTTVPQPK
jgi:hypothetical protein